MGYGMSMDEAMDGAVNAEKAGFFSQLMAKLPSDVQVVVKIIMVVIIAAIAGMIIGKMYAAIKYPDPEKHYIISPKLKVLFVCILAACCFWLYATMTREDISVPEQETMGQEEDSGISSEANFGEEATLAVAVG